MICSDLLSCLLAIEGEKNKKYPLMSHILESNKRLVNLVKEIFFSGYQAMLVSGETVVDQETKNALNDSDKNVGPVRAGNSNIYQTTGLAASKSYLF